MNYTDNTYLKSIGVIYLLTGGIFGLGYLYDFWTLNNQIAEINSSEKWQ